MKTTDLLQLLQTVLLAAVVAFLVLREDPLTAGAEFESDRPENPAWSQLRASLDRFSAVMEQSVARAARPGTGTELRRSIAEGDPIDLDPLVAQLKRLENALRGVRGVVDRAPAVVSMREQYAKTEWAKLKPLYRQYLQMSEEGKEDDFKRDFLLISQSDVLRRFGKPTGIDTEESGQAWRYSLEDDKGEETLVDLTFVINSGFVVNVQ